MSLNLLNKNSSKPWLNPRVNNLTVDNTLDIDDLNIQNFTAVSITSTNLSSNTITSTDLTVNGSLTAPNFKYGEYLRESFSLNLIEEGGAGVFDPIACDISIVPLKSQSGQAELITLYVGAGNSSTGLTGGISRIITSNSIPSQYRPDKEGRYGTMVLVTGGQLAYGFITVATNGKLYIYIPDNTKAGTAITDGFSVTYFRYLPN